MTTTITKTDVLTALELYGQHHPDCAALWPEKPCDCGLSQFVKKAPEPIDMHPAPGPLDELPASKRRPGTPDAPRIKVTTMIRACCECGTDFEHPRKRGRPLTRCEECRQ